MANYDAPGLTYDSGVFYDDLFVPQPTKTRMAKVKLNLENLTEEQLVQKGKDIKLALTGNANFTTPMPTLLAMGTVITTAETKLGEANAAAQTAKQKTTEKNVALDALRAGLTDWGTYVQLNSGGDAVKIQSAGMDVKAAATPAGVPTQVLNLSLTTGDTDGELMAQWDRVPGAKTYEVQLSPEPMTSTSWAGLMSVTKSEAKLTGLTSGQRVWVRVRAVGPAGTGGWSDPATKIVP